ncbi:hypothetical protein [Demequina sp.]|uniref:hypothetical protein n=1 Tax=Demequina sp. TaxID=2050685 RepID=UPI003A842F54
MDLIARGHDSGATAIWAGVFWLLAIIAIGAFVYALTRLLLDRRSEARAQAATASAVPNVPMPVVEPAVPARAILDERLARGEIDVAEYRERLDALGT